MASLLGYTSATRSPGFTVTSGLALSLFSSANAILYARLCSLPEETKTKQNGHLELVEPSLVASSKSRVASSVGGKRNYERLPVHHQRHLSTEIATISPTRNETTQTQIHGKMAVLSFSRASSDVNGSELKMQPKKNHQLLKREEKYEVKLGSVFRIQNVYATISKIAELIQKWVLFHSSNHDQAKTRDTVSHCQE